VSVDWEPIVHMQCGGVALRKDPTLSPRPEDLMDLSRLAHKDGRPIQAGELRVCDSCEQEIGLQPDFAGGPWRAVS
jgi:hypothetical protein